MDYAEREALATLELPEQHLGDLDRLGLVGVQENVDVGVDLPGGGSGVLDTSRQPPRDALVDRAGAWAHDEFAVDEADAYREVFG